MAIIKKNEFRAMGKEQLKSKLIELKKELIKINAQISTGTPPQNPGGVKEVKKTIARIFTRIGNLEKNKPKEDRLKE